MKCQQNYLKNKKGSRSFLFSIEIKNREEVFPVYFLYLKEKNVKLL